MEIKLLSKSDLLQLVNELSDWQIHDNKLTKTFVFKNFIEAFSFMTKVAMVAESMCHHPEWANNYGEVKVRLTTHDLGGITNLDLDFAKKIENLVIKK